MWLIDLNNKNTKQKKKEFIKRKVKNIKNKNSKNNYNFNKKNFKKERIKNISKKTLRACYSDFGIFAGRKHFNQYWVRDSMFSSLGALTLNDIFIVKKNLDLFHNSITKEGSLPLRIGDKNFTSKYVSLFLKRLTNIITIKFFKKKIFSLKTLFKNEKVYYDDKTLSKIVDSNSLFIILNVIFDFYMKEKYKENYLDKKKLDNLNLVFEYQKKYLTKFGLIYQKEYSDWADSIKKVGYGIYANSLYYASAKSLEALYSKKEYYDKNKKEYYKNLALEIKELINSNLYNKEKKYYYDFVNEHYREDNFNVEGNFLTILFNIVDKKQKENIFLHVTKEDRILEETGINIHPNYDSSLEDYRLKLIGLGKYHNGFRWLWISGLKLYVNREKNNSKKIKEYIENKILNSIYSLLFIKNKEEYISEVYYKNKPFKNIFYESETPFAWSAGMLLFGLEENKLLNRILKKIF